VIVNLIQHNGTDPIKRSWIAQTTQIHSRCHFEHQFYFYSTDGIITTKLIAVTSISKPFPNTHPPTQIIMPAIHPQITTCIHGSV